MSGRDIEVVSANGDGTETVVSTIRSSCIPPRLRPGEASADARLTPQTSLISRSRSWRYSSAVIGSG